MYIQVAYHTSVAKCKQNTTDVHTGTKIKSMCRKQTDGNSKCQVLNITPS